ncbi:MAG: winged helix-turn-helix domain-containing protein [Acidobacteriota bacterium]|nr:winged helix-turn-helix domain-containing protein [Acidobacteriota bacterium]
MSLETKHFYEFGNFRLDLSEKVLLHDGEPVSLTPKVFQTLEIFVQNAGRLMEKDELMRQIWHDRFVEESNLTFNIKTLRRALSDDAYKPLFIETVPRRGYRFIAEVRCVVEKDEIFVVKEKESVPQLDGKRASPAKFPHPTGQSETQHSGRVVALADWRYEANDNRTNESATATVEPVKSNRKIVKLELTPAQQLINKKRNSYFSAGIILVTVLMSVGYVAYRFASHEKTMVSAKSNVMRLTSNGKTKLAAVSPDGKFVAYVLDDEGQQSLWLKNVAAAGSDVQILPPVENVSLGNLTFSPDGNHIYYGARDTLYQLPILGGSPKKILQNYGRGHNEITFSPEGKQFAFIRFSTAEQENSVVVVADAEGTNERIIASSRRPTIFLRSAAWSPDGKVIACAAFTPAGSQEVVTVRLADGVVSSVPSPSWGDVWQIVWRPDGSGFLMLAASEKTFLNQLWSLSYPGGEAQNITNNSNNYQSISLTSNGRSIVAVRDEQEAHLWIMPGEEASQGKQLTSGFEKYDGVWAINWTTDGRIIYEADPGGYGEVWALEADGRNLKQLADDTGATGASPDGKFLLYQSDDGQDTGLFRLNLSDGERKRLTIGTDINETFSPDGRWIIFTRYADDVALWKISIDGGEAVKLTNCSGYPLSPTVSPDGKLIAFYRLRSGSSPPISIIPFEGGEIIKAFNASVDTLQSFGKIGLQWTPDGQALNYVVTRDGVSNIWRQPIDGNPPAQVTNFESGLIFNFAYSPDGKQLVLSRGTFNRDVILINNFE